MCTEHVLIYKISNYAKICKIKFGLSCTLFIKLYLTHFDKKKFAFTIIFVSPQTIIVESTVSMTNVYLKTINRKRAEKYFRQPSVIILQTKYFIYFLVSINKQTVFSTAANPLRAIIDSAKSRTRVNNPYQRN